MLFDHAGAQGHGGHRHARAHGVIRQAHIGAEGPAQKRHGHQVGVLGRRGIARRAFQQRDVGTARAARRLHRLADLDGRRHAGGDDHRLAGLGHAADQRQVHRLEGGDLVGRHVEAFQQLHRVFGERRGKREDALLARPREDRRVPVGGGPGLFVEVIERAPGPERLGVGDGEFALVQIERHAVGGEGLDLERIRPGGGGGVHDGERAVERPVMVARHLRDDEGQAGIGDAAAFREGLSEGQHGDLPVRERRLCGILCDGGMVTYPFGINQPQGELPL